MSLDWRRIPSIATGRFDLVIAADVLYEERNVAAVAGAIDALLAPAGEAFLADPGRSYLGAFLAAMAEGWQVERLPKRIERPQVEGGPEIVIQLFRLRRKSPPGGPRSGG
jgi:hypothetical protein